MTDEKPLKSSLELAMERLAKKDADAGIANTPITDAQKAAIAETRNFYESKLAELEVLHQSKINGTFDPAERRDARSAVPPRARASHSRNATTRSPGSAHKETGLWRGTWARA